MIRAENLSRRYGPFWALEGVSFQIERGQVVGFLGSNGAGKSTTMRILAGYLSPTMGHASVAGHDVQSDSLAARRNIGYLPENVPLYPEMRVEEYLGFRGRIKGLPRSERTAAIGSAMERCGISDSRRMLIGSLSKGQRQRVGIADAILHDPPVLILDEPTIGLDPIQVRQLRGLIRELGRDHTVLLSTHILSEVEMVCGRVLIIRSGRIVFEETLDNASRGNAAGRIIVELRAPAESALAALSRVNGVATARILPSAAPETIRLELIQAAAADPREEIHKCITAQGWALRELHLEAPSLEETFVRLTATDADSSSSGEPQ